MKMHKLKLPSLLVLFAYLAMPVGALASGLESFQEQGTILHVDKNNLSIKIGDSTYTLAPSAKIYSISGSTLPLGSLAAGTQIRFNLDKAKKTIQELVIVPTS